MDDPPQRHIPIPGTHNFRDAGGYRVEGGGSIRWRTLFRTDSLHNVPQEDLDQIVELGVRSAVDVRYPHEVRSRAHPLSSHAAVAYHNAPLSDLTVPWSEPISTLEEMNLFFLDDHASRISAALQRFAAPGAFPALVNCTLGKDRTGLVVALLLAIAGVSRGDIVRDYMLSDVPTTDLRARTVRLAVGNGADEKLVRELSSIRPSVMERTLDHLETTYGGAEGYARSVGLTSQQIESIREALVALPT